MSGEIAVPRLAASLIILRDGAQGVEALLVERTGKASFAAGKFVFPGGTVDREADAALAPDIEDGALRAAAIRETYEESGLLIVEPEPRDVTPGQDFATLCRASGFAPATHRLVRFAHWITPISQPKRFDTHFYLAAAPSAQVAQADQREVMSAVWRQPRAVVAAAEAEELDLMFATYMNLRWLSRFESVTEALSEAAQRPIVTVVPRPEVGPDGRIFHIPADAGYGEASVVEKRFRRAPP